MPIPDINTNSVKLAGTPFKPHDEDFVPLEDGNGLAHTDYKRLLEEHNLGSLEDVFKHSQGESLHKPGLGHRERLRIKLSTDEPGKDVVIYLKRFGNPGFGERIRQSIKRGSRDGAGVYDFSGAVRLAEIGVPVPRAVAYGQERGFLGGRRSFAILEELPGADALERILPNWDEMKNEYRMLGNKRELIKQLAGLVKRLHESGLCHRDLYLSHIFLGRDEDGKELLSLIDLNRVFQPVIVKRRWIVKDLAQLYFSSRGFFRKRDMVRFLHEYFGCDKLDKRQKRLVRSIVRKTRRMDRHARNSLRKLQIRP